jgi:hypothetical protein
MALAVLSCGTASVPPGEAGAPGASAPTVGPALYTLSDLGDVTNGAFVNNMDVEGRISGGVSTLSADGTSSFTGGVYTPGAGWSAAPVPDGARYVSVVGIDVHGNIALNASFPCGTPTSNWDGLCARAYRAYPLELLDGAPSPAPSFGATTMHPVTGHIAGWDADGPWLFDGVNVTVLPSSLGLGRTIFWPNALNGHDQAVGLFEDTTGYYGYVWDRDTLTAIDDGGTYIEPEAISENRLVTGSAVGALGYVTAAFLWDGELHLVGCPAGAFECQGSGINSGGQIIGTATVHSLATPGAQVGFVYRDGTFHRLDDVVANAAGWSLDFPNTIADDGRIAGVGTRDQTMRAFLLTPR